MMNAELNKPFESIESAHEFVALLEESIQEAADDVRGYLRDAEASGDERQVRALNLALLPSRRRLHFELAAGSGAN